jgi:ABC-type phosphate transport system substrate-binding protein
MRIGRGFLRWFVATGCALATSSALAEVVVIVSAKSPITVLRREQVADIFLGKTASYPNGDDAVPLDQQEESMARQHFYAKVIGKPPAQLKAHWAKLVFTGKGQPPRELPNSDVIKKMVGDQPKYIGYIEKNTVDASVKIVLVVE